MVVVGTYDRSAEEERAVSVQEVQQKAQVWDVPCVEVSIRQNVNVEEAFAVLVRKIRDWRVRNKPRQRAHKTNKKECAIM